MRADAVVVGTGAGGAVAAYELAAAGLSVVVLEEGGRVAAADFTARPRDMTPRFYRDGGQTATIGTPPIAIPLGRAVGGTTILNSATCYRTPPALLARWGLWTPDELEPYLRRVERLYGVGRVDRALAGRNAHLMEAGARRLGWSGEYLHRAARGCVGSGVCAAGCPSGGKQHTANTYVPRAEAAGATLVTGARVTRVLFARGPRRRAVGVGARLRGGGALRVDAALVVVAAGAIGTPVLLKRSGVRHPRLGRNLSVHPATGVWAEFDEDVRMSEGVPQAYAVDEFAPDGIMLEGWTGPPDLLALAQPRLASRWATVAQAGLMIRDDARGSVHAIGGRAILRYALTDADLRRLRTAIDRAEELMRAAGAHTVHRPFAHAREAKQDLLLTAFHPLGTAAAGDVVDGDLMLQPGLMVADGSAVPSALGVNPQLTIMALATRAARRHAGVGPPHEAATPSVGRAPSLL